jgi:transposase
MSQRRVTDADIERARQLAAKGHSQTAVAKIVGLSRCSVKRMEGIQWRPRGQTLECLANKVAMQARNEQKIQRYRFNVGGDKVMKPSEIAKAVGCSETTIYTRIKQGVRGAELLRPRGARKTPEKTGAKVVEKLFGHKALVSEIATIYGLARSTIKTRILKGWRGQAIVKGAPVEVPDFPAALAAYRAERLKAELCPGAGVTPDPAEPRVYKTGLTCDEWVPIVAHAREHGAEAAAKKWGLPVGAVRCMLTNREHFVD